MSARVVCDLHCACICHDGISNEHVGRPCPGKTAPCCVCGGSGLTWETEEDDEGHLLVHPPEPCYACSPEAGSPLP